MVYDILFLIACLFLIFQIAFFIYIKLYEKRSIASKFAEILLIISRSKRLFSNPKSFNKKLKKKEKENIKPYKLPKLYQLRYKAMHKKINNLDYVTINEKGNTAIIYFHGGAFLNPITIMHYQFLDKLAYSTNCKIFIPIYKKIPNYDLFDNLDDLYELYKLINENFLSSNIIAMGDSAGANLIFSFNQYLKEKNDNLIKNLFLFSPWLDLFMENELIDSLERKDPMLSKYGLIRCAKLWCSNKCDDLIFYPLKQDLSFINNISLFVGTHDIFLFDCRDFYEKWKNDIKINYHEYNRMDHDFILFNVFESKKALKIVEEEILNLKERI